MRNEAPKYDIHPADAIYLMAMMEDPNRLHERSAEDLKDLLVNVLKLAESISDNCRTWLEDCAIIHGDMHPYSIEKLNVPTLKGALSTAVTVPRVPQDCAGMCHTCAFRVGSQANQTEAVAADVMDCLADGTVFYCHDVPEDESPKHPCRGFVAALKAIKKQ